MDTVFTTASAKMLKFTNEDAFLNRGIDPEIAAKYGATFSQRAYQFEYSDKAGVRYRKFRSLDKRFWADPKGVPPQLWGLDMLQDLQFRPAEPLVLTEGEFDRLAILQAIGGYAASVPNGAPAKPTEGGKLVADDKAFAYLWGEDERLIPELAQFDRIILATDGDGPGTVLRNELAIRIGETKCWFVKWPKDCKDANDVLMKHGADALSDVIGAAKPMRPGKLVKPSDLPNQNIGPLYSTGFSFLDKHIMMFRKELMVVTGIPGHGKSQWVRSLCFHLAEAHGLRTAFFCPEDPAERLLRDMRRFAMRNVEYPIQSDHDQAAQWIDKHFMISTPDEDDSPSLEFLENEMASAALHNNCQVFVIDPWNEISHNYARVTETQYIETTLAHLKRRARRYGLILIIVVHPRKIPDGERATMYTINGSANWKNKADHGIIITKLADADGVPTSEVDIETEKSKDHETTGTPGKQTARFIRSNCDYVQTR